MKRALITGANRGIGLAIAKGLKNLEFEVIIGARDLTAGEKAAKEIGAATIELDVANPENIISAINKIGSVDVLINNAGILGSGGILDDPQNFIDSFAIMVHGPYLLIHHLVPHMIANKYGRIVNISSGYGAFAEGIAGPGAYGAAKAALNALTISISRNLPKTIKINSMCPGWVRTRMGGMNAPRSPEQGADTAIWLATLDKDGPTGGFFRDRKLIEW